ncbi:peptidoglycan-binding domain-containing protein [Rhodococcus koreensis]
MASLMTAKASVQRDRCCNSCANGGPCQGDDDTEIADALPRRGAAVAVQRTQLDEYAGGCGVCLGPVEAGNRAHDTVSTEFRRSGTFRLTDIPITAPEPDDDTPTPFTARPDFVILTPPDSIQVGELKPPLSAAKGRKQVEKYISKISQQFPGMRVRRLNRIVSIRVPFPNPEVPKCPTQDIVVASAGQGLFLYGCVKTRNELRAENPDSCACKKNKKEEPEKEKLPVPPPKPSPDVILKWIQLLDEVFGRRPVLVPQPAQPPLFIPKIDCPPDFDPDLRPLFCKEGPVASFCTPHEEAALVGFRAAPTATDGAPVSRLEGLARGDGMSMESLERRPRVQELQSRLTGHEFPCKIDGKFGPKTTAALNGFQTAMDIEPNQIVTAQTADALERGGGGTVSICAPGTVYTVVLPPELSSTKLQT